MNLISYFSLFFGSLNAASIYRVAQQLTGSEPVPKQVGSTQFSPVSEPAPFRSDAGPFFERICIRRPSRQGTPLRDAPIDLAQLCKSLQADQELHLLLPRPIPGYCALHAMERRYLRSRSCRLNERCGLQVRICCPVRHKVSSVIRLLYMSRAAPGLTDQQVQEILASSRKNNPRAGLTGVLVRGGGLFMQVLEGPEQAVLRNYVRIMDDSRHVDCQILYISPANERMFENWSMGMIPSTPLKRQDIAALQAHRLESVHATTFAQMMRAFVRRLNHAATECCFD